MSPVGVKEWLSVLTTFCRLLRQCGVHLMIRWSPLERELTFVLFRLRNSLLKYFDFCDILFFINFWFPN